MVIGFLTSVRVASCFHDDCIPCKYKATDTAVCLTPGKADSGLTSSVSKAATYSLPVRLISGSPLPTAGSCSATPRTAGLHTSQ